MMQSLGQKELDQLDAWCLTYDCKLHLPLAKNNLNPFITPSDFSFDKNKSLYKITVLLKLNGYSFLFNDDGNLELVGINK